MNYTVQPGDTLYGIATRFNVSIDALIRANNLTPPYLVYVGQRLFIPAPYPAPTPAPAPYPTPQPGTNLERRVNQLERRQDRLENRLDRLEQRVRRLEQ